MPSVSAEVVAGSCETPEGCDVEGGNLPVGQDGGLLVDVTSPPLPGTDASQGPDDSGAADADASEPSDASSDGSDPADGGGEVEVNCGDGVVCVAPEGCCLDTYSTDSPRQCTTTCGPTPSTFLTCDGPEDFDPGWDCCGLGGIGSVCRQNCVAKTPCHRDEDCGPGRSCTADWVGFPACE